MERSTVAIRFPPKQIYQSYEQNPKNDRVKKDSI